MDDESGTGAYRGLRRKGARQLSITGRGTCSASGCDTTFVLTGKVRF